MGYERVHVPLQRLHRRVPNPLPVIDGLCMRDARKASGVAQRSVSRVVSLASDQPKVWALVIGHG